MDFGGNEKGKFFVIDITGKIDRLKDSIVLKSYINSIIESGNLNIALNLSTVTYLDSGALNVLIYSHNTLSNKGGSLVLIEPNEYVRDVLEVVGLNKLVTIFSSRKEFDDVSKKR
ncbi:MAG: STAS domain-containing protein [Chitinispirillaceae bacterium]|jgi:anti-sigma B factor antagonist|nr:STAS domain-containing protein [Chitinispirillaceae bacterium]